MSRAAKGPPGVALFPFLALLVCAMGALVVLLVVVVRNSRLQAAQAAAAKAAANATVDGRDLNAEKELLSVRVTQLTESRAKTAEQLEEERLRLSSVEDHLRHLREQLNYLATANKQLQQSPELDPARRQATEAELTRLRTTIADTQKELDGLRKKTQQGRSFAILPYEGPNKTRRRPLYVECREDGIILQPEGIVLTAEDFPDPTSPGNPLAVAMRAAREHIAQTAPRAIIDAGEPYPLLLVRPDGVTAYYVAREAMTAWGSDFGYELLGNDWQLEFLPADPALAQVEKQAIDDARMRQQMAQALIARRGGGGNGGGGGGSGGGGRGGAGGERPLFKAAPGGGGLVRDGGPSLDAEMSQGDGQWRGGAKQAADGSPKSKSGSSAAQPAQAIAGAGQPSTGSQDSLVPQGSQQMQGPDVAQGSQPPGPQSLAQARGKNWALGNQAPRSVPVTRPIRIECRGDQLTVFPDDPRESPRTIALVARSEDSVDELVASVRSLMKSWGIAGNGMYWRPLLTLELGPSGEGRFAELQALLADSGFDVKRR